MDLKNFAKNRWTLAAILGLLGALMAWLWDRVAMLSGANTELFTQQWTLREAPIRNWNNVLLLGDLVETANHFGSFDLGPLNQGLLELRLYIASGSTYVPDWKLAWVPFHVTEPDWEKFMLSLSAFLNMYRVGGEMEPGTGGFRVIWRLPEPARKVRVGIPPQASLRIERVEAVIPRDPAAWHTEMMQRRVLRLNGMAAAVALFLFAVMLLVPDSVTPRLINGLLLAATLASFLVTVFWLPPFQGPDEQDHWRDALARYRRHAVQERLLYNLPEITGFDRVRWRSEAHVSPTLFRQTGTLITPFQEPQWVNYAGFYSYPVVALVSWLFPRVETVQEALLFYYLCRLVPVVVLGGLLYWAWRNDVLPAIALAVFSSPYVQQQCVVVSTDTLANLAAVGAGLCWLALRRRWTWSKYVGLWLAVTLCFLAKPPIYVLLFVLPVWGTPWRRLRLRAWLALGIAAILMAITFLLVWRGYRAMHQVPVAEQFREQWHFVFYEGGWHYFLNQPLVNALDIPLHLKNWFMPLGWVDTFLHPYHLGCLRWLVYAAILCDLARAALKAPRWWHVKGWMTLLLVSCYLALLLLGTWVITAIVMYLAVTPPRHPFIYGMQVRYLFPCVLAGVWLPLSSAWPSAGADNANQVPGSAEPNVQNLAGSCATAISDRWLVCEFWAERVVLALWAAWFFVLAAARLLSLVGDLAARYW